MTRRLFCELFACCFLRKLSAIELSCFCVILSLNVFRVQVILIKIVMQSLISSFLHKIKLLLSPTIKSHRSNKWVCYSKRPVNSRTIETNKNAIINWCPLGRYLVWFILKTRPYHSQNIVGFLRFHIGFWMFDVWFLVLLDCLLCSMSLNLNITIFWWQ